MGESPSAVSREPEKFMFRRNPTSMLGLSGDVFFKSSAAVFAAAPKLPEMPDKNCNVVVDEYIRSPINPNKPTNPHSPL